MMRLLAILLACLALAGCAKRDPASRAHPALWEIAGPREVPAGWLFGTAHSLPDGMQWRTPRLDQALGSAQVLVVEIDNPGDTQAIGKILQGMASDEPQPPLASRVSPELRARLAELLSRNPRLGKRLDRMETWAAALTVARLSSRGSSDNGVDAALIAEFAPRPVVQLEGAVRQLGLFDRLPEKEQRDMLDVVLREGAEANSAEAASLEAWQTGNIAALERLTDKGLLADPELRQALLVNRNRDWTDRIVPMLQRGEQPFVAVGAAHLVGPDGLIALLEARGYTVRRIQ